MRLTNAREPVTAVNIEVTMPMLSVTAKPLIGPVPKPNSMIAAIKVVAPQMAQTVAYLQENELLDYTALAEKAAAASARFNDLSAKIKSAETRMAEIAVLRKHIVNYAKSRDTYAAYRKAGYSKKFLAEHESEITLHKAAKNYFDGLGLKKLPTIKALNTEYAELLVEKKAAYADYRKAREDMKELLTAKANIDRILELDKEQEEANERREQEAEQR